MKNELHIFEASTSPNIITYVIFYFYEYGIVKYEEKEGLDWFL